MKFQMLKSMVRDEIGHGGIISWEVEKDKIMI